MALEKKNSGNKKETKKLPRKSPEIQVRRPSEDVLLKQQRETAQAKLEQERLRALNETKKCISDWIMSILKIEKPGIGDIAILNANRFSNQWLTKDVINSMVVDDLKWLAIRLLSSNVADVDLLHIVLQKINPDDVCCLEKAKPVIIALNNNSNIKKQVIESVQTSLTWSQLDDIAWWVGLRIKMLSPKERTAIWSTISAQWDLDKKTFDQSIKHKSWIGKLFARAWRAVQKLGEWLVNKIDDLSEKVWLSTKYESDDVYETIIDMLNPNPPSVELPVIYASASKLIEKWDEKDIVDVLTQLSVWSTGVIVWWAVSVGLLWASLPLTWMIAGPLYVRWVRQNKIVELLKQSNNNVLCKKVLVEIESRLQKIPDSVPKIVTMISKNPNERLKKYKDILLRT